MNMLYIHHLPSPQGRILLSADDVGLCGLWFEGQAHFPSDILRAGREEDLPLFEDAARWLDIYFAGNRPDFDLPVHLVGTDFQVEVWELLRGIPYGCVMTYGEIASRVAARRGLSRMSAQAVGGAVSRNPLSIVVPCHRVVGAKGALTGYAGGLCRKRALLLLEGVCV